MEKKLLLVYNPVSGKAQIKHYLSDIIDIYSSHDYCITLHPTKCAKDGYEYIKEHMAEYEVISVCGGDGMLNEAVSALMCVEPEKRPKLAYLPSGSTNDFAGTIGIPSDVRKAAKMVVEGTPFFCDAGRMNDKHFAYVAAFGAFTSVSYDTSQEFKNIFGHMAYIIEGIRQLSSIKVIHATVKFDDVVIEDDFILGAVSNSFQIAGMKHTLGATISLNDGLFEVLLIKKPKNALGYQNILSAFVTGNIEKTENIISFKASKVTFECDEPIKWTVDGEYGGELTFAEIVNIPRAFSVIV
ncbi:MAG: diacylglycerol kinase family lipid kinase [Clostridia bacterium]|nr:diacylglycerol kinase family lipid kinase [Clostridia bacterium]